MREALRALEKNLREEARQQLVQSKRYADNGEEETAQAFCNGKAFGLHVAAERVLDILATASEQAPVAVKRDRPAQEPGGVECQTCGCIFIGEEWHSVCAVCLDKPGSERLCDFFANVGEVEQFMDDLCNVVTELTGDEGEDDPLTVLRRYIASSPAHTSEERDAARYRWLRDTPGIQTFISGFAGHSRISGVHADVEIDAAMRQEAGNA